ncbi:hypothetical protein [Ferrimonas balearica]|uniref:hypothetical protein n=1 Tax=Ferrimonas balearica TaxID=44012 RepID=UPI001C993BB5|nr:hypothetical protein [Ferrimonas balearica]MBY5993922.1 hypothetical protein [Ferrimonas balearica]
MNDSSWTTLGILIAGVLALIVFTWVFVILRRDRAHDKEEQLRSDAAVDSALSRVLAAYQKAVKLPGDESLFEVEQRLKDLLLVVVSFEEVDEDFKTLPQALEEVLGNLERLQGRDEEDRVTQLTEDMQRMQSYHQNFERLLDGHPT